MAVTKGQDYFHAETFYDGILALPPAAILIVDGNGLQKRTYWRPEIQPDLIPQKDDDAFQVLRNLLVSAVESRLRGSSTPATLLSGGLDSSAITAIAAKRLEAANRPLLAFSAVLPEETRGRFEDERAWIEEFHDYPNLTIQFVTAPGRGPFDSIRNPRNFEHSFTRSSVSFLDDEIEDAAMSMGADVALTGHGGEFGATARADGYVLELLTRMKIGGAFRVLRDLRRTTGVSPLRIVASELKNAALPVYRRFPLVALSAEFRRQCAAPRMNSRHFPDHRKGQLAALQTYLRSHAKVEHHRPGRPIQYMAPFWDKAILEFCLSAHGGMKVRNGYHRYLVRAAMEGIMPQKIQWRTSKCAASPDYIERYSKQVPIARDFLRDIRPNDPVRSIVDVDWLQEMVQLPEPPPARWDRGIRIPNSLYLICFLRQFSEFQP